MNKEDAEEYTQSLGQIVAGSWRQIALAKRLGIPKALGLTVEEWVKSRLGGYIKYSIEERREIVKELTNDGMSTREVADVLGITHPTVLKDKSGKNLPPEDKLDSQAVDIVGEKNSPDDTTGKNITPIDAITALAATEKVKETAEALGKREQKRQEHKETIKTMEWPEGKYRIIYADPPWSYGDTRETLKGTTGAKDHYVTMPLKDICNMQIEKLCTDDAVLFLWVPSPLLEDAFDVISAWGFSYKASFVWDKIRHNLGNYNSVRHELLLVATRGSCIPDNRELYDSVQAIDKSDKHSEKPEHFRSIIDDLYPHGPRIELFRRGDVPENWRVWGNEVSG